MNINASIIDQRLSGIQDEIKDLAETQLNVKNDVVRLKSLAFVYLCVKTMLDLDTDEAFDCLMEGGGDFGVDAMHLTEEVDGEFAVTLFQGKYKTKLEGNSNFEENAIKAMIDAIRHIFDPSAELGAINKRLKVKVEAARSMIRDGYIPRVRAIACNNGIKWNADAQEAIKRAELGDQVTWEHVNHDVLIGILQRIKPVDETLRLAGKAIVEDMSFSRICIGRIPVTEIAALMKAHGEKLLERNIRRYLGLHGNRVNEGIRATLNNNPANFYFFNNGLTLVCNDFSYNALQGGDYQVKVENLQIVNGGQTCMTIFRVLEEMQASEKMLPIDASVLVRIYKLPKDNEDIVLQITHATNSQNPVDLKDLRSNDEKQQRLENSIQELNFKYHRKRLEGRTGSADITSGVAAVAVLAVWRESPHQARTSLHDFFGKLYEKIFTDSLNGAQTITAVLLYRIAEKHRIKPMQDDQKFIPYASCFIAMQMGRYLLKDLKVTGCEEIDHRNFNQAKALIDNNGEQYFSSSIQNVTEALSQLYGKPDVSLQQLSATFRRGDLINLLPKDSTTQVRRAQTRTVIPRRS